MEKDVRGNITLAVKDTIGKAHLIEHGILRLDMEKVRSIVVYKESDSFRSEYIRDEYTWLFTETMYDEDTEICTTCGYDKNDKDIDHSNCTTSIYSEESIMDYIRDIIDKNKEDPDDPYIIQINGTKFKVL